MEQNTLLKMVGITKTFPGVKALDGVNLEVKRGTVHALMGENGAGKSTLMKCLFGMYVKDGGQIYLEGKEINFKNSKEALDNGVAMVHQELNQALKRNVMDNIWLGRYPTIGGIAVNEKKMYEDTMTVFKELGINVDPHRIMSTMPVSQRQMVEIAKAVSYNSKVIVFDEPTSSLTEEEVEHLFEIINMLRDRGVGIIYISHKMAEIKRISDYITVMRDGKWIATERAEDLEMQDIIRLMVGRELTNQFPPKTNTPGEVYLKVEGITGMYNQLKDVSFEAKRGEILGLAGLDASGRTETLESIFGIRTRKEGKITLGGKLCQNRNARESIKNGFALLTEERRATGIFGVLDIKANTVISSLKRHKRFGVYLSEKSQREDTQYYIDAMRTKTPSQETKIRSLSGG
ncbi:MAG: ATP-binding cassette domain-containing protein, partial [Lachnospiraceae bacterium]|nr:ATP-binding cassette domain-containing protein [Lachnospiraceae bacterium]